MVRSEDELNLWAHGLKAVQQAPITDGMVIAAAPVPEETENLRIGAKLRHARRVKGLSLKELADTVGCSESLLSKVENDRVRPSLQMLHKIVHRLDTSIAALFTQAPDSDNVVTRAADRRVIRIKSREATDGVRLECLVPWQEGTLLQGCIHVVEPGKGSEGQIDHQGEEVGYVVEGELELTLAGRVYHLAAGDSFFFPSHVPHGYRNPGTVTTRVIWINSPPTF